MVDDKKFLDYDGLKHFKDNTSGDINARIETFKNEIGKNYVSKSAFEDLKNQVEELKSKLAGN